MNVVFGVLLVLLGLCTTAMTAAAPTLFKGVEKIAKDAQAQGEAKEKADLKAIDDKIAAAKTDEEKKQLEQEKVNVSSNRVKVNPIDISTATDVFKDPTIKAVGYSGLLSGLVLHIMLLVSGIGLMRLAPWGRMLSLWWSCLMIVQVLALLAANVILVLPANKPFVDRQIAKVEEAAKAPGAGPTEAFALQMAQLWATLAAPITVASSLTGIVYPIVLLVLLNQASARAACSRREIEGMPSL